MVMLSSENELEDFIVSQKDGCGRPLFYPRDESYAKVYRQFNLPGYGIIDLLYFDSVEGCPEFTIVELKKTEIDTSAIAQIARYRQGLKHYLNQLPSLKKKHIDVEVYGVLVGAPYREKELSFLVDSINWLSCYSFTLEITKGIKFEEVADLGDGVNWHRTNTDVSKLKSMLRETAKEFVRDTREMRQEAQEIDRFFGNKYRVVDGGLS